MPVRDLIEMRAGVRGLNRIVFNGGDPRPSRAVEAVRLLWKQVAHDTWRVGEPRATGVMRITLPAQLLE